jgi:hypothetical protein
MIKQSSQTSASAEIPDIRVIEQIRKPEELQNFAKRFGIEAKALRHRRELIDAFRKTGANGASEAMAEKVLYKSQEFERKESFLKKAGSVLAKPIKWTYETAKKHPYITAGIIAAGLFGVAYYTGFGASLLAKLQAWIASAPDNKVAEIVKRVLPDAAPKQPIILPPGTTDVAPPPFIPPSPTIPPTSPPGEIL